MIDDAHWAEPALLDLLLDLVSRLRDAPVLLVWVARSGPARARRAARGGTVLTLQPLSAAASESLLAVLAGGRLDPVEAQPDRRRGRWQSALPRTARGLRRRAPGGRHACRPRCTLLLAERLDRLDAAERSALALASIAGDAFEPDSVHDLSSGITRAEVEQACERLVDRDLLVRSGRRAGVAAIPARADP